MLQITRAGLLCTELPPTLAEMRRDFDRSHALRLQGFLHQELLDLVHRSIRQSTFYDREDEGLAREQCMHDNPALGMLFVIANDARLFEAIRQMTGCGPIGCFIGRVYLMRPGADHYDRWHSDMDGDRLIGMSVNLSDREYKGGEFELRKANAETAGWTAANTGPGDAVLFRIADDLQHRVTAVEGDVPRVAFAGWFQSRPDFLSLLKSGAEDRRSRN